MNKSVFDTAANNLEEVYNDAISVTGQVLRAAHADCDIAKKNLERVCENRARLRETYRITQNSLKAFYEEYKNGSQT